MNTAGSLRLEAWEEELPITDPQRDWLLSGIRDGFNVVEILDDTSVVDVEVDNYKSATCPESRVKVEHQIIEELQNGRYIVTGSKPRIVSALGAIPKSNGDVRLIHDCSRPKGTAVNDYCEKDPFQYQSIQDATDMLQPGYYMCKIDCATAYRSVRVHPSNHSALGLKWNFSNDPDNSATYMVDTRLPFGARKAPFIFHQLGQAVRRIMQAKGYHMIVNMLDDFLVIGQTEAECWEALIVLLRLLRKLGFAINYNKVTSPAQRIVFLGILLDSVNMTIELPRDKIEDLEKTLTNTLTKRKISKKALQSLAGKLNFATQCIYGGRFYLRRLFDAIARLGCPWHRTRVTREMRLDIEWWLHCLRIFNGHTQIVDSRPITPICIDSCAVAAGGTFGNLFVYTPWHSIPDCENLHINFKEVLALEPAIQQWAPLFANKKVLVHCDNQAAVAIINRGSCSHPTVTQSLRRIFWLSVIHNFRLTAVYIRGKHNVLADAVSRLHESPSAFRELNLTPVFVSSPQGHHQVWKLPSTARSTTTGSRHTPPPRSVPTAATGLPIWLSALPWGTPLCLPPPRFYAGTPPCWHGH